MVKRTQMLLVGLVSFVPAMHLYAQDTTWIDTVGVELLFFFDATVAFLAALALVVFIWGGVLFVLHADNEKKRSIDRQRMVWGIVGLFVVMVIWGIVQLLTGLLGIDVTPAFQPPQAVWP